MPPPLLGSLLVLAPRGVDVRNPDYWQKGFAEIRRLVDWATALAAQVRR